MFQEYRASSLYEVSLMSVEEWCGRLCFYHLIVTHDYLCILIEFLWSQSCNYFVYATRTSLFLIRDLLSVFALLLEGDWGSNLLYANRTCTVYSIVLSQICILPSSSQSGYGLTLAHAVAFTRFTQTQWQVFKCICFKGCVCGKESECKVQTKITVLYRKRYSGFLFWNVTKCSLLYIFCI